MYCMYCIVYVRFYEIKVREIKRLSITINTTIKYDNFSLFLFM